MSDSNSQTGAKKWTPGEIAAKRFPGNVTVPRALLAEAYRALKSYYALPTLRAEIDRLLGQPDGPSERPVVAWKFRMDGVDQVMLDEDADIHVRRNGTPLYATKERT